MLVTKADGTKEPFSEEKLQQSIAHAGVPHDLRQEVIKHIQGLLYDGISTREIYKHIGEFLEKSHQTFNKDRYSLKQSIMDLVQQGIRLKIMSQNSYVLKDTAHTYELFCKGSVLLMKLTLLPRKIPWYRQKLWWRQNFTILLELKQMCMCLCIPNPGLTVT